MRTLKPGQRGTKEWLARHGASLLCVRYRYDEDAREHLKTVELVVQRRSPETEHRHRDLGAATGFSSSPAGSPVAGAASGDAEVARVSLGD